MPPTGSVTVTATLTAAASPASTAMQTHSFSTSAPATERRSPVAGEAGQRPAVGSDRLLLGLLAVFVPLSWLAVYAVGHGFFHQRYMEAALLCHFLPLIGLELLALRFMAKAPAAARYSAADSWASMGSGSVQFVVGAAVVNLLLMLGLPAAVMQVIRNYICLWDPPADAWWAWLVCLLAVDCEYYWAHRFMHTNATLWAGHSVHHSSDHYNFSTAMRQSWWQRLSRPTILVLAPFFSMPLLISCGLTTLIYQFWLHTSLIGRLGPLEYIFNTPSAHRVHHDRRVHKNFGGMFIIWDRMFGTFVDERDLEPAPGAAKPPSFELVKTEVYELFGIMRPPLEWVDAALQHDGFVVLWNGFKRKLQHRGLLSAAWALVQGPGYYTALAPRAPRPADESSARLRREPSLDWGTKAYVFASLALSFAEATVIEFPSEPAQIVLRSGVFMLGIAAQGLVLDRHRWASIALLMRAAGTGLLLSVYGGSLLNTVIHVGTLTTLLVGAFTIDSSMFALPQLQ